MKPARLVSSSCSLKKILQCSCSFHGVPTPKVSWWIGNNVVKESGTDDDPKINSTILAPWANTTISVPKMPPMHSTVHCEARNGEGKPSMSVTLMSIKSPLVTQSFVNALFQGFVYGAIATTLLFLCLFPFIVNYIRKKLSKKIAVNKAEMNPSQPSVALKMEESGKSTITPSPEIQCGSTTLNFQEKAK